MSKDNPVKGIDFRAARESYKELWIVSSRCRDERVITLREYIAQNESRLARAREDIAKIPATIAAYQAEMNLLAGLGETELMSLVAASAGAQAK